MNITFHGMNDAIDLNPGDIIKYISVTGWPTHALYLGYIDDRLQTPKMRLLTFDGELITELVSRVWRCYIVQ